MKQSYALFLFISTLWFYKIMLSDCTTDVLHKENKVVSVSLPAIISSCIAGGGGGPWWIVTLPAPLRCNSFSFLFLQHSAIRLEG